VAQDNERVRDTGRHKATPPTVEIEDESQPTVGERKWFLGFEMGAQGGQDLWHLETISGLPPAADWIAATPFTSERFNATLDSDFSAGLTVGRQMGEMWSLEANLASSRMDLAAEALQGEGAAVYLYDRLTITSLALAAEVRLVRQRSYPFMSLGLVLNHLSAARETDLNQDQIGLQMALGYAHHLSTDFMIKVEARYSRSAFDIGDFVPRTESIGQPPLTLEPADNLNLYGLFLGVQMSL